MTQSEFLERSLKAAAAEIGPKALNMVQADIMVRHIFDQIAEALKRGDTFQRDGEGTFQFIEPHPARSGQASDMPPHTITSFNPDNDNVLKELVPKAVQELAGLVAKAAQELGKVKEG